MENKKQSSLEFFAKMLAEQGLLVTNDYENLVTYQEAKAMHKEEQRLTYEGVAQNLGTSIKESDIPTFEEYYNETFGGRHE